jgi:hypothetical protein
VEVVTLAEEPISVYPNPATQNDLNVRIVDAQQGLTNIKLMDIQGRPIYDRNFEQLEVQQGVRIEPTQTLIDGMYVIVVQEATRVSKLKVIIRN